MKTAHLLAGCLLLLLPGLVAARSLPLVDPGPIDVPYQTPQERIAAAIRTGLEMHHWKVLEQEPGRIRGKVVGGGDVEATVDLFYDERQIRIRYVGSNMEDYYTKGEIDSRYINWTRLLARDIGATLGQWPQRR